MAKTYLNIELYGQEASGVISTVLAIIYIPILMLAYTILGLSILFNILHTVYNRKTFSLSFYSNNEIQFVICRLFNIFSQQSDKKKDSCFFFIFNIFIHSSPSDVFIYCFEQNTLSCRLQK